jgi:hypothetical protein
MVVSQSSEKTFQQHKSWYFKVECRRVSYRAIRKILDSSAFIKRVGLLLDTWLGLLELLLELQNGVCMHYEAITDTHEASDGRARPILFLCPSYKY